MELNGASVLVTGATGFIGPCLVQALAEKNVQVKILSMNMDEVPSGLRAKGIEIVTGDITKPKTLSGITENVDSVFHLAAVSNVDYAMKKPVQTYEVNVRGTVNLLEEVRKNPVQKFIYVSSSHVYGAPRYLPVDEIHPVMPREPYAASKAAAENIVNAYSSAYGVNTAILRPFNIYGPAQNESFLIPSIVIQALSGNDVIEVGNIEPTRDFTYITDVVEAFLKIAEYGTGVYNIGSGVEIKVGDIIRKILDIVNPDIEIRTIAGRQRTDGVEISRMCADVSRLEKLGWKADVTIEDGLREIIKAKTECALNNGRKN